MTWTRFMDMHSGGGLKEAPYTHIYIEAPEEEAKLIFYNRFGHNPDRVSCTCCGEDYSIGESKSLKQATGYERGCAYDEKKRKWVEKADTDNGTVRLPRDSKYTTIEDYEKRENVLIIRDNEINASERKGDLPEEGYVWI